ncbi:unnamed protein product [Ilex paraguariensis]|uniref:Uncharacterized protein n=1 Tax=Ilex paraguariensis TaxID=185542 RepID=A0ABC8RWN5_9AQUA
MKRRQRNVAGNGTPATKRKVKRVAEKVEEEEEEVVVVEERKDGGECVRGPVEENPEMVVEWEEWQCWWSSAVDELMSWGAVWCPFWDVVEFMGEDCEAYDALYSDVVWDYDVWDLKGINEVPKP